MKSAFNLIVENFSTTFSTQLLWFSQVCELEILTKDGVCATVASSISRLRKRLTKAEACSKHFIISPKGNKKRGTGVTDLLKFVFSRGNSRICHKNHVKIIVQVTKNKDSLRKLYLAGWYLPNRPGNHQTYNSLLENMKKEYEGRAGGNRGTSRSDNGEGIVQQLGTSPHV